MGQSLHGALTHSLTAYCELKMHGSWTPHYVLHIQGEDDRQCTMGEEFGWRRHTGNSVLCPHNEHKAPLDMFMTS